MLEILVALLIALQLIQILRLTHLIDKLRRHHNIVEEVQAVADTIDEIRAQWLQEVEQYKKESEEGIKEITEYGQALTDINVALSDIRFELDGLVIKSTKE